MHKKHTTTIWPYYFPVVSLFVLSLVAPSNWKQKYPNPRQPILSDPTPLSLLPVETDMRAEVMCRRSTLPPDEAFSEQSPAIESPQKTEPVEPMVSPRKANVAPRVAGVELSLPLAASSPSDDKSSRGAAPQESVPTSVELVAARTRRPDLGAALPSVDDPAIPIFPPQTDLMLTETDASPSGKHAPVEPTMSLRAVPQTLLDRLAELETESLTESWAAGVAETIGQLTGEHSDVFQIDPLAFAGLSKSVDEADALIGRSDAPSLQSHLRRARYALERRTAIWQMAAAITRPDDKPQVADADGVALADRLASLRQQLGDSSNGRSWSEYLLLDSLDALANRRASRDLIAESRLSQRVLARLEDARRVGFGTFVATREMNDLDRELRGWVVEPVDVSRLLTQIEHYEQSRLPSDAREVAIAGRRLGWSKSDDALSLSKYLDMHYRNANLRISISDRLLNRLLPQTDPKIAAVHDTIGGNAVRGEQRTSTHVSLAMVPDPRQISIDLNIVGRVHSNTVSQSGPATFRTRTNTDYSARKRLVFNGQNLTIGPATSQATSNPRLYHIATDFDSLPLIGDLARDIARSQHDSQAPQLRREVEQKAAYQARRTFDAQADPRLMKMIDNARERINRPLEQLGLAPRAIETKSDAHRASVRYRLAGDQQLGAHTPRPRAPSDSFVSVQVHETSLNNALENLQLNGRTFELRALFRLIAERLGQNDAKMPEELPEGVEVTFADQDAVHARFEDGAVLITLRVAAIVTDRRHWREIVVHARYEPQLDGLDAQLVRTTSIRLSGSKLSTRSSIALRSIFSRMFTRNRQIPMIPRKIVEDRRLNDLEVTQAVITDGWIGMAIGPHRSVTR